MSFLPPLDFSQSPSKSLTTKYSPGLQPEPAINDDDADDDSNFKTISTLSYSPRPSNDDEHAKFSASVHRLGHADSALGQLGEDADEDENVEVETVSSGTSGPCVEMASVVSARNTVGGRRKLVKKGSITATRGGGDMRSFRCDIQPPTILRSNRGSFNFSSLEYHLKTTILVAGGRILDKFAYPGGFLYALPSRTLNPLTTSMHPSSAEITITPWTHPFAQPQFNGLRLTPYGGAGDFLLMPVPAHLSSTPATPCKAATSEKKASEVIRRSWLGLAGDRGSRRLNAFVRELGKLG